MLGVVVAENRTRQGRARIEESPHPAMRGPTACLLVCLLDYLGAQATTTLTATPCRCGRNVARPSSSKTKVPPGLMA
jgi:hypothetical protein